MRKSFGTAMVDLRAGSFACWVGIALAQSSIAADIALDNPDNFTPRESEQLLAEAGAALNSGDFRTAERAAADSLQILKVNYGLLSETQFPALKMQSEALQAQLKWDALDQHFAYFEWLLSKLVARNLDSFLSGTEILNSLYLTAAADLNSPRNAHYLIAAKQLSWRAISAIEQQEGSQSLRLAPWLHKIVLSHYYQSALIKRRGMTSFEYKTETPEIVNGWSLSKNESIEQSYNIGLELLNRIRTLYASSDLASAATDTRMLLHVADWELLFDHGERALELYRLAFTRLQAIDPGDAELRRWFATPVIIPMTQLMDPPELEPSQPLSFVAWSSVFPGVQLPESLAPVPTPESADYVANARFELVAYPVAESGANSNRFQYAVQDLTLDSVRPDTLLIADRARRQIANLQFRPALSKGQVVPGTAIELTYIAAPGDNLALPITAR